MRIIICYCLSVLTTNIAKKKRKRKQQNKEVSIKNSSVSTLYFVLYVRYTVLSGWLVYHIKHIYIYVHALQAHSYNRVYKENLHSCDKNCL